MRFNIFFNDPLGAYPMNISTTCRRSICNLVTFYTMMIISLLITFAMCAHCQINLRKGANMLTDSERTDRHAKAFLALDPINPHYFLFRGEPTILITSGEHYGAVLNLDFDYHKYLETLHKDGLNLTRTWSGSYREIHSSFGITDNTLAPLPNRYVCPWKRSDTSGYSDGGNKFDLTQWDPEYFKRLKDFMNTASKYGVVVEMNLFCPNYDDALWKANPMYIGNNINGVGDCPADEVYTLKHPDLLHVQDAMVRKIVRELKDYDNLYYEVCNEPYFGGVSMDWQRHIVSVIEDEEKDFPQKHLISMNIANDKALITDPVPGVSIFNFHYATPPVTVGLNYGLDKVIGENETGFRGKEDYLYRTEGWEFILAGGGLYNNLDYSFTCAHPDGTFLDYASPGGGSPELRHQLGILKRFINGFDFIRMAPDDKVVQGGVPEGARVHVLAIQGKEYAIYLLGGTHADLQLALPSGEYEVKWLDTKTGKYVKSESVRSDDDVVTLSSPDYTEDIALSVRAKH